MDDYSAKFCPVCSHTDDYFHGYYSCITDKGIRCHKCDTEYIRLPITSRELIKIQRITREPSFIKEMISLKENNIEDFNARMQKFETYEHLYKISQDESFINAMIELKEKDPIEYQLKMQQFQASQPVQQPQPQQTNNLPKCPRCGSTSITAGQRGYSIVWGFLGSSKTVNRCSNCGHKWTPER